MALRHGTRFKKVVKVLVRDSMENPPLIEGTGYGMPLTRFRQVVS
jgi:hypothetical protein